MKKIVLAFAIVLATFAVSASSQVIPTGIRPNRSADTVTPADSGRSISTGIHSVMKVPAVKLNPQDVLSRDRQPSATTTDTNSRGTSLGTRRNDNSRGTSTGTRSNKFNRSIS